MCLLTLHMQLFIWRIHAHVRTYIHTFFLVYLQHVPLQIVILHAWKDHLTRFTLYTFLSYFRLIPMAVCVLFFLT